MLQASVALRNHALKVLKGPSTWDVLRDGREASVVTYKWVG